VLEFTLKAFSVLTSGDLATTFSSQVKNLAFLKIGEQVIQVWSQDYRLYFFLKQYQ
jgi:hypothetical protein